MQRRPQPPVTATLLLLVLCAVGCSGPASRGSGTRPVNGEGTIIYHDPVVRGTLSQREHRAVTQVYTTADDELRRDAPNVQVYTGNLPSGTGRGAQEQLAERMFNRMSQQGAVRLLSPEQFTDLWSRLDAAGLFEIPRGRSTKPPADKAYFHVKTEGRQWIITRPALPVSEHDTERRENARRWQLAKTAVVTFENDI